MNGYRAALVAPVGAPPIVDGAVMVEAGRIAWVGRASDAPTSTLENLGDVVITPGLVNAHTHLDLTCYRGVLVGLDFFAWIRTLTQSVGTLTPEALLDSARSGLAEGIAHGITTFADTAPNTAAFDAMIERGVRGIAYREVFGPDPAVASASLAGLEAQVGEMRVRETPLVRVGVSPHAPYSVSDPLFAAVAEFARREGLPMAIHIAESEAESQLVSEGAGPFAAFLSGRGIAAVPRAPTPIALLAKARALGERTLLIHCVRVNGDDIVTIARHGCGVAHCPASNAWFGHGTAPAAAMLADGVRLGMGTDGLGSNTRMDVLGEAAASLVAQRTRAKSQAEADALAAADPLTLATLGGARALRMEHEIGTLSVGHAADLAVFDLPAMLDRHHPPSMQSLGHALAVAEAKAWGVMVAGQWRRRAGAPDTVDIELAQRVDTTSASLKRWRASRTAG